MKKDDAIQSKVAPTEGVTHTIEEEDNTPQSKKDSKNQNKPIIVKVKNINRNHRGVTYVMVALVIMFAMSYLLDKNPELETQYPWLFWISRIFLRGAEAVSCIFKLLLNLIYDAIPIGHRWFENIGEHLSANWNNVVEALSTLWQAIAF